MRDKKKLTRKQISEKYENLKIDSQNRMAKLRKEKKEYELGAAQLQALVDILMGRIIETYGERQEDGTIKLYVPTGHKKYKIEGRVREEDEKVVGVAYIATEIVESEEEDVNTNQGADV